MRGTRDGRFTARALSYCAAVLGMALPASAGGGLSVQILPEQIGPGDDVQILVDGPVGEYAVVMTSPEPGPTEFPVIGPMAVGPAEIDYIFFGPFDESGPKVWTCTLSCLVTLTPVYAQAASFSLEDGIALTDKSEPFVVQYEPSLIQDCDGNLINDDCEEFEDCNGNGIPDLCDINDGTLNDEDMDGVPDECCPVPCKMRTRFTFNGPLPDPPYLLTVWIMVPGTNSTGNRIEVQLMDPPRAQVLSPNGAVRAFNFQFTPMDGLTFLVDYCPEDAGIEFGDVIWLMAHAGDAWLWDDISAPNLPACELTSGTTIPSEGRNGSFQIIQVTEDCLAPFN